MNWVILECWAGWVLCSVVLEQEASADQEECCKNPFHSLKSTPVDKLYEKEIPKFLNILSSDPVFDNKKSIRTNCSRAGVQ